MTLNKDDKYISSKKIEMDYINHLISTLPEGPIRERVSNKLRWYVERANANKRWHYFFTIIIAIINAFVIFLTMFLGQDNENINIIKIIIASLAGCVNIILVIKGIMRADEKWILYRKSAELIKREAFLYLMKCGDYEGLVDDVRDCRFSQRLSYIGEKELSQWEQLRNSQNGRGNGTGN